MKLTRPAEDARTVGSSAFLSALWLLPRRIAIFLIRCYKRFISPLLPPVCRFTPSCSEYAMQAYAKYGLCKGTLLTAWRLLRCNPFCQGGHDPVP